MRIKDIVIIGMMSAILITVQVALAFLPNVELVSLLIILCTLILGYRTLFIIYIFATCEIFLYGLGTWTINYLYVWTILFLITMAFRKERSPYFWAIISGLFGLSFGALCSFPYYFSGGIPTMAAYWVSGIIFDLVHGAGNFVVALVLFKPLYHFIDLIYRKWDGIHTA